MNRKEAQELATIFYDMRVSIPRIYGTESRDAMLHILDVLETKVREQCVSRHLPSVGPTSWHEACQQGKPLFAKQGMRHA